MIKAREFAYKLMGRLATPCSRGLFEKQSHCKDNFIEWLRNLYHEPCDHGYISLVQASRYKVPVSGTFIP